VWLSGLAQGEAVLTLLFRVRVADHLLPARDEALGRRGELAVLRLLQLGDRLSDGRGLDDVQGHVARREAPQERRRVGPGLRGDGCPELGLDVSATSALDKTGAATGRRLARTRAPCTVVARRTRQT